MNIIEVSNLVKKYKKATTNAVDNISFQVNDGEFFAFLGPNGAGKTTTISILTTTLAKSSGCLSIAGYDVDKEAAQVRKNIGVIFQNLSLDLNLTAEENIRLHTILYKMYDFRASYKQMAKEYQDNVINYSEILGIKNEIFKPIKTFSGGMKRKLEIIRTLIHKPKVLFLDEPTNGLDPLSRKNLWEYLNDIRKKEKTTIFLTTHYLEEAEGADRVCVINHGKIAMIDTLGNLKNRLLNDYIYMEAEDKEVLQKELVSHAYKLQEADKGFKVISKNTHAQEIIKSLKTKLTKISIIQPTLEDAYLDLIKEKDE